MKKEINVNKIIISKKLFIFISFLFLIFIVRICYLCLIDYKVNDTKLSVFIENRNIKEEVLYPNRGTIYDKNGNILAKDVSSYKIIAYLDESRSENSKTLNHVKDINMTAKKLSPYVGLEVEELVKLLSKDAYQVELGVGGKNLSQIQMEEIKNLNLPGIDFIKSSKRYYPNSDFASYMIGYTTTKEDDKEKVPVGEMGIEEALNKELTGEKGYKAYEKDRYGYKIANGREYIEDAKNGNNVYLTIDNNIELFIEKEIKKVQETSEAEWVLTAVMDAKTGAILGYSSTPSFDPNLRNMTSYLDPIISSSFEPGSTMKIFSFMCALEKGTYKGDDIYLSGSKTYESEIDNDTVTIRDWNNKGWGKITYDEGFALSSNIAVANLLENAINKDDLKKCYSSYGFGKRTNIYNSNYNKEYTGRIDFKYDIEAATAGYGQGITTTPIQHLQALSIVANDGDMLKPYIVDKIVDDRTKKTIFKQEVEKKENIVSKKTTSYMTNLLRSVVNPDKTKATGYAYYLEDYDLIGKTGTAQIFDHKEGHYLKGPTDYIYSFSGIYPGDNPEIIIYTAIKKPKDTKNYLSEMTKNLVINISKYLNIKEEDNKIYKYTTDNYINKYTKDITNNLDKKDIKYMVLGTGDKIIDQYPKQKIVLNSNDKIILLTNKVEKIVPSLKDLSFKEVKIILDFLDIKFKYEGVGYLDSQSIEAGNKITDKEELNLIFKPKY